MTYSARLGDGGRNKKDKHSKTEINEQTKDGPDHLKGTVITTWAWFVAVVQVEVKAGAMIVDICGKETCQSGSLRQQNASRAS